MRTEKQIADVVFAAKWWWRMTDMYGCAPGPVSSWSDRDRSKKAAGADRDPAAFFVWI